MARVRKISTMAELQAAMQAAFNAINRDFYNGELEKCVISVKEGRKDGVLGTFYHSKDWIQSGTERHEITISANYIGQRTVIETITTLMHEMVHLYCFQNGIKDTSRSGTYHNKNFKREAENHGLDIEMADKIGWSVTKPKPATEQWIKDNIPIRSFGIYKQVAEKIPGNGTSKPKQSMRKKVCPCCGNIARVTSEFKLICGECNEEMTEDF